MGLVVFAILTQRGCIHQKSLFKFKFGLSTVCSGFDLLNPKLRERHLMKGQCNIRGGSNEKPQNQFFSSFSLHLFPVKFVPLSHEASLKVKIESDKSDKWRKTIPSILHVALFCWTSSDTQRHQFRHQRHQFSHQRDTRTRDTSLDTQRERPRIRDGEYNGGEPFSE